MILPEKYIVYYKPWHKSTHPFMFHILSLHAQEKAVIYCNHDKLALHHKVKA